MTDPTRDAEQAALDFALELCGVKDGRHTEFEARWASVITAVRQAERARMTDLDSVIGTCADGSPYTVRMLIGTDAKLMTALKAEARAQAFADVRRVGFTESDVEWLRLESRRRRNKPYLTRYAAIAARIESLRALSSEGT